MNSTTPKWAVNDGKLYENGTFAGNVHALAGAGPRLVADANAGAALVASRLVVKAALADVATDIEKGLPLCGDFHALRAALRVAGVITTT